MDVVCKLVNCTGADDIGLISGRLGGVPFVCEIGIWGLRDDRLLFLVVIFPIVPDNSVDGRIGLFLLPLLLAFCVLFCALAQGFRWRRGRNPSNDMALWEGISVHLRLSGAPEELGIFLRNISRADFVLFAGTKKMRLGKSKR